MQLVREQRVFMRESHELVPLTLVKLILELHPVQPQVVQEALQHVHEHQHEDCHRCKHKETYSHLQSALFGQESTSKIELASREEPMVFSKKTLAS